MHLTIVIRESESHRPATLSILISRMTSSSVIILYLILCIFQVHPNANRPPHLKLKIYEFAGKLVGKCLYESSLGGTYRQLVTAKFTRSFLAQLIGLRVNYKVRVCKMEYHNLRQSLYSRKIPMYPF